jgi:23S rRNA (uracil747-C5)-methyltransferase
MFQCAAYNEGRCRSCSYFVSPSEGLDGKLHRISQLLSERFLDAAIEEGCGISHPFGSRVKAKLQVGGTISRPVIGLTRQSGTSFTTIPLPDCPLQSAGLNKILEALPSLITDFKLLPYNIEQRTGELKAVILSELTGGTVLRFIVRSRALLTRLEKAAQKLMAAFPEIQTVSANIQPIPHPVLEGEEEILLSGPSLIKQSYGDFFILLPPRSFFQITPEVATALYKTGRDWLEQSEAKYVLDLFCGAGGFLLSVAKSIDKGLGIEINFDSVAAANDAAFVQGFSHIHFKQGDLSSLSELPASDTVIVNPPRRGLEKGLIEQLRNLRPRQILYSSCNPETLFRDIELLGASPRRLKAFDMFPLTSHVEILALINM